MLSLEDPLMHMTEAHDAVLKKSPSHGRGVTAERNKRGSECLRSSR